jgi:Na+/melibiose symporter-like transporter
MEMSIGAGISIVGVAAAVAGVIISIAKQDKKCAVHDVMVGQISDMKEWLIRVERKIDEVIQKAT